ncbi:MAG TPA: hypothetical protein VIZ18_11215, partial [Ktedonobacteraceae bacterium]
WTYTTLNGQVVAQNQPDEADNLGTEYLVDLSITRTNGQWHVSTGILSNINTTTNGFISGSPSCEAANNLVTQTGFSQFSNINLPDNPNASVSWNTSYGSNVAAGCLLTATALPPQTNPSTPVPTPPPFAHCLYRFGVLLALDSAAHKLWPNLPLADAYEQSIAQSIKA